MVACCMRLRWSSWWRTSITISRWSAMLCKSSTPHKPGHNISMYYLLASNGLNYYCVMRAPLLLLWSWVALFVFLWVSEVSVIPVQISPFFQYILISEGIQALGWPSIINYQLVPPHTDSVPPTTNQLNRASSPRNAQLSQLDLVINVFCSLCHSWYVIPIWNLFQTGFSWS